jgi:hypothetical protein
MELVRLLTLWPPFGASQFIVTPEVPSHWHTLVGPSQVLYVIQGCD